MKKALSILSLTLMTCSVALASNQPSISAYVQVTKCTAAHTSNFQAANSYSVRASDFSNGKVVQVDSNENGVIHTELRLLEIAGKQRIKISTRYVSNDSSEKSAVELVSNFSESALARAGECESSDDVGNLLVSVSTQAKD